MFVELHLAANGRPVIVSVVQIQTIREVVDTVSAEKRTLIHFDGRNTIEVAGSYDEIVNKLLPRTGGDAK